MATTLAPGSKDPPHITPIPPIFQAVPCRPIVLDTAINAIVFPSLEGRVKKEDKKKTKSSPKIWILEIVSNPTIGGYMRSQGRIV